MALALGLALGFALPVPARADDGLDDSPRPRWSTPLMSGPNGLAADADGVVVTVGYHQVVALDRRGREVWHASADTGWGAPVIDGDTVVLGGDGSVTGLARVTGVTRWTQPLGAAASRVVASAGTTVVTELAGGVRAFDSSTGLARWTLATAGTLGAEPAIDAPTGSVVLLVCAVGGPTVRVVDALTGVLRWEHPVDWLTAAPVASEGAVFVAEGDGHFRAVVLALDLATGQRRWALQVPASFEPGIVPVVDDRALVVVDHYGHVTAVDPADGQVQWERDLDQPVLVTRLVLTARRLTVSTAAKDVAVLDRGTGRIVRRISAARLGGWAVDVRPAAFAGGDHLVAAIRLGDHPRVELWR
jgi:outer membrane protein assembly factor BamB